MSRNAVLPARRRLALRIRFTSTIASPRLMPIYGDGVNIAARVEGLAEPGGISISGAVYDQVKKKLALTYEPRGEHVVKNIREPVRVYRVLGEPEPTGPGPRSTRIVGRLAWRRATLLLGLVLLVAAGGAAVWSLYSRWRPPGFELPDRPSVAVLPFENMSGDPGQEYFGDGITEDLITGLSKLSGLFVIART